MLDFYLPIAGLEISALILIAIGFAAGVLGGFFGVGGSWIVTPTLNIFGFPMATAIGTDLAQIFGKSIAATARQGKLGNVDLKLGLFSIVGSIIGVETGAQTIMWLSRQGLDGPIVRGFFMVLLFGLGSYMLYDFLTQEKRMARQATQWSGYEAVEVPARKVWNIPPIIHFPVSGITISFWTVMGVFFITGWLSGFLGVGGSFIRMPALIYLIGCSTAVAVGTDLFSLLFIGAYGCFTYGLKARVEVLAAVLILLGGFIGSHLGATAVRYVRGPGIRLLFAITLILAGVAVTLMQFNLALPAAWLMMVAALGTCVVMLVQMWRAFQKTKAERSGYLP